MPFDGNSRDTACAFDQLDVTWTRAARRSKVHCKRPENFVFVRHDRCRPAGAQTVCCGYIPHLFKDWIGKDVFDENGPPLIYCLATRTAVWADLKSIDPRNVGIWKIRGSAPSHL